MQKIYNILAKSIRQVLNNFDSNKIQKYTSISDEKRKEYKNIIYEEIPDLFTEKMNIKMIKSSQLYTISDCLEQLMIRCDNNKSYELMIMTIQYIDFALENILVNKFNRAFSGKEEKPLNSNYSDINIKLFPRVTCMWERKSRGRNTHIRIDNFLKNLLIIDYKSAKEKYNDKHFFLESRNYLNNKFKFATFPYCNKWNQEIEFINDENYNLMHIKYKGNKSEDLNFVEGKIEEAIGENIVIFPEVHGCYGFDEEISIFLAEEINESLPEIIVLPSCWDDKKIMLAF